MIFKIIFLLWKISEFVVDKTEKLLIHLAQNLSRITINQCLRHFEAVQNQLQGDNSP